MADGAHEQDDAEQGEHAQEPHGHGPPELLNILNTETEQRLRTVNKRQATGYLEGTFFMFIGSCGS